MKLKDEFKAKEEKPKQSKGNQELNKLKKCLKHKDKRITALEKRLDDRVKIWISVGIVGALVGLWIAVLCYIFINPDGMENAINTFVWIGCAASIITTAFIGYFLLYCIWETESEDEKEIKEVK